MSVRNVLVAGLILVLTSHTSGQSTVVTPNAFAGTEANTGTGVPLQNSGSARTYQMQIGASQLATIPVGSSITGLRWRLDAGLGANFPPTTATWSPFEITLAQAANSMAGFSTNFAGNMTNPVLVRSSDLTFSTGAFSNAGSPTSFGPLIAFDTSYLYQGGDMVLLVTHAGSNIATAGLLDAADDTSPGYGTNYRAQFGFGFEATTASVTDFQAVITQFQFTIAAVPEPTTWALLGGCTLFTAVGSVYYRRRRTAQLNAQLAEVE
ncbi:MAG: hypothetical protein QM703_24205 [Gemmatales bacterium]